MSLENFKNRKIEWDTVNKNFDQSVQIVSGDVNSRTVTIVITDNGEPINLTGYSVKLVYKYIYNDNSGFVMLTPTEPQIGEFSLTIPTEMTSPGSIKSNLILLNENLEQVIVSKNLKFISDDSTVTDLAQEVNSKIDDFTKLLLENMPQVMRSELNDLHAQSDSNTSNIDLKANLSDMTSLQSAMNNLQNKVEAFGITPDNLVTIKSLSDEITGILSDLSRKGIDISGLKTKMANIYSNALADHAEITTARGSQSSLDARLDGLNENLQNQINTNETSITTTGSRIDNLIANAGDGTVPSEVIDARVGVTGTVYSSLGNAIRTMFSLFDATKQTKRVARMNLLLDDYKVSGYYRQHTDGAKLVNADYDLYDMIPVNPDTDYYSGFSANAHITFYDFEKKYISGLVKPTPSFGTPSSYFGTLVIKTPWNAKYVSYSLNRTNIASSVFYENYDPILDTSQSIFDGLLPLERIANFPLEIKKVVNQNMFNKSLVVSGRYLDSSNGGLPGNATYCVYFMKIKPSTNYTTSGFVNNHDAFYDASGAFISAGNKSGTITTPANAMYWGVSMTITESASAAICEGNVAQYSDFGTGAVFAFDNQMPVVYEVGAKKKFTTIQSAVNFAKDGDTILISAGTYHEAVDAKTKLLHFKGVDKNTVTLEYENGAYSLPPLEISKGTVENMTIHAISQALVVGEPGKAYCFHADYDLQIGHTLSFTNVKFINDDKQVIGVGLRNNFTLEFNSCDFITPSGDNAFYVHDDPIRDNSSNQNLIVKDCSIVNNGTGATIHMQSQERVGAVVNATWQRNIVVNLSGGKLIDMATYDNGLAKDKWLGSSDFALQPTSAMNNIAQLNFN